jgi:hypothetical protein
MNPLFFLRRKTPSVKENKETAECKHEWEEVGKHAEATADFQVIFHDTHLKCKLCGKEAVRAQTEYQYH